MKEETFEFYRGTTYSRDFTLTGWSLFIEKMYFTVKENINDKNPVLQKKLGDGITLVSDEDGVKTFNILIDATDTDNMKTDFDYVFDIKIVSPGEEEEIKDVVLTGVLRLTGSATAVYNEV